ncbi:hypothetical protein CXB51_034877 [Gossypium anomalum]|uniref:Uncharacterized protein n=1 Tax=Gossypium anomalum TaxID=47600 RepID=A0A8J5XQB4_9ROSI|nr:hypothetical protein CXB51_034877 [Gossypium anomalum]
MAANTNTFSLRSILEKDKLNGLNFLDRFRNLRIVLKKERKLYVIEKPLPDEPPANASRADKDAYKKHLDEMALFQCKLAEGSPVGPHVLKMIGYFESLSKLGFPLSQKLATDVILQSLPDSYSQFVLNFNMNEIDKTLPQLLSNMKKVGPKPILMVRNNKGKGKAKVPTKPKGKGKPNLGKGKATLKPKCGVSKEGNCFHCGVTGHWKRNCPVYLEEIKKARASGTSASGIYGLQRSRTLTRGDVDLRVGNGARVPALVVGTNTLSLRSGLVDMGMFISCTINLRPLKISRNSKNEVQNQLGKTIKTLRSDRSGEYLSLEFDDLLKECGIVSQLTPPGTPQWNGVSERRNRTLLDMVRSMMSHADLPTSFWGHALETTIFTLNRVPSKSVQKTPYEMWTGKCPKTKGYYFFNPTENRVFVARTGVFLEREFVSRKGNGRKIELEEIRESQDTTEPEIEQQQIPQEIEEQVTAVETQPPRRSLRECHAPKRYGFLITTHGDILLIDQDEPRTYQEVVASPDSKKWLEAMRSEMDSMYENQVWTLVDPPEGVKPIGCKWVFKKKTDMDGNVQTYKGRLVIKGFRQIHGVDYDETFSLVAMFKSIRILLAMVAFHDYEIWQMDVKIAFLNGKLEEDVYMTQPEGFIDPKDAKKIYEPCVYKKVSGNTIRFLVLYVDDILIMVNGIPTLQSVKTWLGSCFSMKDLGEATYILGAKIYRDISR